VSSDGRRDSGAHPKDRQIPKTTSVINTECANFQLAQQRQAEEIRSAEGPAFVPI
jgi:hypothetical protein